MAVILNEEQQSKADQIREHDLYNKLEKKYDLLFSVVQAEHKPGFFHRLFKKKCKICAFMKVVK